MNYAIIYDSQTGNTEQLAKHIAEELKETPCKYLGDSKHADVTADLLFIGFWTDKGTCSKTLQQLLRQLHHKKIALFGTAGFGGSWEYFQQILNHVKEYINADCDIVNSFMCQGKMPFSIKKRYEIMLEKQPGNKQIKVFLTNFDQALTHPDIKDEIQVREFAKKAYQNAVTIDQQLQK